MRILAFLITAGLLGACVSHEVLNPDQLDTSGAIKFEERKTFGPWISSGVQNALSLGSVTMITGTIQVETESRQNVNIVIFEHRKVIGLDLRIGAPDFGITLGATSQTLVSNLENLKSGVAKIEFDSKNHLFTRGCFGKSECWLD